MRNPLFDSNFLRKLDLEHNKHILGKVISLTLDEQPREEITGKVTGGTINIDGSSAVRRTCNLTLVAKDISTTDYYWALTSKIRIEIGVRNTIDARYPDIIWFPMGTYILTSFSVAYGLSNITVSLSGKDKMAMLNGDLGGVLTTSSYDFANIGEIYNAYTPVVLSKVKFITQGKLIVAQSNKDLDNKKYLYFPKNILTYSKDPMPSMSVQRLSAPYEVFAIKDETTKEYIITTKFSSKKDYYRVTINDGIAPVTSIDSPLSLFRIEKNFFYENSNGFSIIKKEEEDIFIESKESTDKKIILFEGKSLLDEKSRFPVKWIEISEKDFISEEDEIDTNGYVYKPYYYYFMQDGEPYISEDSSPIKDRIYYKPDFNYFKKTSEQELKKLQVKDIIREMLHEHGKELYSNIIIEDIPNKGKELLELSTKYKKEYLYLFNEYEKKNDIYEKKNIYHVLADNTKIWPEKDSIFYKVKWVEGKTLYIETTEDSDDENGKNPIIKSLTQFFKMGKKNSETNSTSTIYNSDAIYYEIGDNNSRINVQDIQDEAYGDFNPFIDSNVFYFKTEINGEEKLGKIIRVAPGQTIGYRETDLTYPGELVATNGENLTIVLDKIKNFLGNYEYFYNLKGQFVFREKRNFLNNPFSKFFSNEDTAYYDYDSKKIAYSFENNVLLTSYSKSPAIGNIKNDFCIWGERQGISGAKLPIHMRYAIDKKPTIYWSYPVNNKVKVYCANEIILGMAMTKELATRKRANVLKHFGYTISNLIPISHFDFIVVDWREIIYQMAKDYKKYATYDSLENEDKKSNNGDFDEDFFLKIRDLNSDLCDEKGLTGYEQYYTELSSFWRQLYNPFLSEEDNSELYSENDYYQDGTFKHWTKQLDSPETLNFWFDFLDITGGELDKYSVKNIGQRTKSKTDTKIKAIKYREIPPILFNKKGDTILDDTGDYSIINLTENDFENFLSVSSQNIDAEEWINNSIYSDTLCTETISITAIPVYYLSPNTLISIKTDDINVDGDYIINRITYSLAHNGMMQIQAIKNQPYII